MPLGLMACNGPEYVQVLDGVFNWPTNGTDMFCGPGEARWLRAIHVHSTPDPSKRWPKPLSRLRFRRSLHYKVNSKYNEADAMISRTYTRIDMSIWTIVTTLNTGWQMHPSSKLTAWILHRDRRHIPRRVLVLAFNNSSFWPQIWFIYGFYTILRMTDDDLLATEKQRVISDVKSEFNRSSP